MLVVLLTQLSQNKRTQGYYKFLSLEKAGLTGFVQHPKGFGQFGAGFARTKLPIRVFC
jgi:hypothetical protein